MPVCKLEALRDALQPFQRLLGLDVGDKTVGMAVAGANLSVASPVGTIRRTKLAADAATLFKTADEYGVGGLIVGLPVNMDGSEGPRCQSVRAFAANLLAVRDLPLAFWDERLSTAAVERAMIGADMSRRKRAQKIDAAAAAYILQGALDALQHAERSLADLEADLEAEDEDGAADREHG